MQTSQEDLNTLYLFGQFLIFAVLFGDANGAEISYCVHSGEGVWLHLTLGPVAHHHASADQEDHSGGRGRPKMIWTVGRSPTAWHPSSPLPFHISFVQWPSPGFPKQYVKMYCCDISREYTYKPVLLNWYPVIYYSTYQKFSTPVQRSAPVSLLRITRVFLETRSEPIQEREIQGYNGDLR